MAHFVPRRSDTPTTALLLDSGNGLPSAYHATSFRLLKTSYTGFCIRVRRSSDNATMDVGFSAGFLDTAAMLTWGGTDDLFITIAYDQSGHGHDAIYASTAQQERIALAGTLETPHGIFGAVAGNNSLVAARAINNARGSATNPSTAYTGVAAAAALVGGFGSSTESLSPRAISLIPSDTTQLDFNTPGALLIHRNSNNPQWGQSRNATLYNSEASVYGECDTVFSQINGGSYSLTVNGVTVSNGSGLNNAFSTGSVGFGARSAASYQNAVDSFWQERIVWLAALDSTQQATLFANQQAFWSTPALAGGGTGGTGSGGGGGTGRYDLEGAGYTLQATENYVGTTLPASTSTYDNGTMTSGAGAWMSNMVSVGPSVTGDGTNCLKIGVHRVTTAVNGHFVVGGAATLDNTSTFMKKGGAWEYRVRSDANTGTGEADLLWPQDPANWPTKGEIDVREIYSNSSGPGNWQDGESNFHLDTVQNSSRHLKAPGSTTHSIAGDVSVGNYQTDWTLWHIVQIIWNPVSPYNAVYIDGVLKGYITDSSYIPNNSAGNAVPMRLTFQTEHYGATDASVSTTTRFTEVDYVKYYALP